MRATAGAPRRAPAPWVCDLAEAGGATAGLVGGKAFPLAVLLRRGLAVPRGFCITTEAFRAAIGPGPGEVRLSAALRDAILAAWRSAGFSAAAVRSSATEEDGRTASFAGVFPTTLPVEDEDALLAAVERCFRAARSSAASPYRTTAAAPAPSMAVLVQELVEADAAGIVFTANPVTGARDEVVLEVVPGLGAPLAAGTVTGDSYSLARDGSLRSVRVAPKLSRLTRHGEEAISAERRDEPAITPATAAAIARAALDIEAALGEPQDVEFALAGERLHVLQARPIPGLAARAAAPPGDPLEVFLGDERRRVAGAIEALAREGTLRGREVVLSDGNVGELLPTPTPMSFGVFREIFAGRAGAIVEGRRALGYRLADGTAEHLYALVCGHAYFNVEIDLRTFDIGLPSDVDGVLARVVERPDRANYPELGLYPQAWDAQAWDAPAADGADGTARAAARRFHASMCAEGRRFLERFPDEIEPALRRAGFDARRAAQSPARTPELVDATLRRIAALKHGSCVQFVVAARLGFYFADLVRARLARHLGDAEALPHLLVGLEGSRITEQGLDLERVAAGRLRRATFLDRYGHLAANELELSLPRLEEDPAALEGLLSDLVAAGRRPAEELRRHRRLRLAAERAIRRRLSSAGADAGEVAALLEDLRLAQAFLPLRETVKYHYAVEYAAIRALLLRLQEALGWSGDDVFHLRPEELAFCATEPAVLGRRVAERRRERGLALRLARERPMPPVIFGSRLGEIGARREVPASRRLAGTPIAPGVVTGVVRLVDCADGPAGTLAPGRRGDEILVARSANLGLAPLLRTAAGLVVEVGGVLAHAACQAREAGIPALVLADATRALRDGATVRVDGTRGVLEVLSEASGR